MRLFNYHPIVSKHIRLGRKPTVYNCSISSLHTQICGKLDFISYRISMIPFIFVPVLNHNISSSLHHLLLKSSSIGESRLYTFSKSSLDAFAIVIPCVAISIKFKSYYWRGGQTGCSPPYIHFLSVPSSIFPLWQEGAWLSGILSYL